VEARGRGLKEIFKMNLMNFSPARWIWLPSERTLANTFVLFRREVFCDSKPVRATGWIGADSRYRLFVNGERIQWGPPPCDPRAMELDPIDLLMQLQSGRNVIGAEVLFYGHGDGTWTMGKPGFLCALDVEYSDGRVEHISTDESWLCRLDRAHRPGAPQRWFLRALQEEFDARLHPHDWSTVEFAPDAAWRPAMPLDVPDGCPPFCSSYRDYLGETEMSAAAAALCPRSIPLLRESEIPALRLQESARVLWKRDPLDWFENRAPDCFEIVRESVAVETDDGWRVPVLAENQAAILTFEWNEQIVGWPYFSIDAPQGTIVECISQESHDPEKTAWLDSYIYSWSRFVCSEGENRFEPFDFESLRWLQLHIRNHAHAVKISNVGVRRREYAWPHAPQIHCDEPALQRLFDAGINTLRNCAQETIVDGMGRERQQYSGDGSHQLHAIRYAFGDTALSRRFLQTFGSGLTTDGYFLDCWPAHDRLARLVERQIDATSWGPLLDHGIGFVFDCWNHFWETGDLEGARVPFDNVRRFADYLSALRRDDGLLPVENLGVPSVWMDHHAYTQQRHKQCAFNLYAAAMLEHALAPLCVAMGDERTREFAARFGAELRDAAVARFWCDDQKLFVNNLPWLQDEGGVHLCDRSLATAVLFDQCPDRNSGAAARALAECPDEMGISYPCNAGWRYQALCESGRADVVLRDFRERWATMPSVHCNNTIQETWHVEADSLSQWSHCALAPIFVLYRGIAGIRPLEAGFSRVLFAPQLGDLHRLDLTAHTPHGPIGMRAHREADGHRVAIELPPGCRGEWRGATGNEEIGSGKSEHFAPMSP